MIYIPELAPLVEAQPAVYLGVLYEKRFTTIDDVTHDERHIHDFYEIYVNVSGDVSFLVENSLYPIKHGDMLLIAPNELHRCIYHRDCVHEHFCIWLKDIPFVSEAVKAELAYNVPILLSDANRRALIDLCFSLTKSYNGGEGARFRAISALTGIFDLICNCSKSAVPVGEQLPESFSSIVDYIICHFMEPDCNVATLCREFYISKSTLCRKFQQHFQMTPSDYIESKRFSEAKKLLVAGLSVQDTCSRCGFSDCSYFILRFRKHFGITPYKYQKEAASLFSKTC